MRHRHDGGMLTGQRLATGLGWFSVGLGMAEVVAPGALSRLIGAPGERSEEMLRAFGAREIGNGVAMLTDPGRPAWVWSRIGGDAIDLAYLVGQLSHDGVDRERLRRAIVSIAGVTALDLLCAVQLNRHNGRSATRGVVQKRRGVVKVERVVTINRPIDEVYRFWRQFENLPRFMRHLESVDTIDARLSRWRAKGPAGVTVAWDAELLQDRPNEWIAWHSVEAAQVENSGSVRFQPAPGNRGTEVRVQLQYAPPGGAAGRIIARLFGEEPDQQIREDLHRFKQLMETGEIPISDAPNLVQAARPPVNADEHGTLVGVPS